MYFRSAKAAKKMVAFTNRSERPLVTELSKAAVPAQGLAGRHIALWQSHGRYFDQKQNRWEWQRLRLWQTCEDLYTMSYVLPYLAPMLENAGADVLMPRERDIQRNEALADNDVSDEYREEAGAEMWQSGGVGFANLHPVYLTGENPFRDGTTRRVRTVADKMPESRAIWSADIPEAGEYAVYVSYTSTPNSAEDAHYTVHHGGVRTEFAVNQTMGGGTWIYLGTFDFAAGRQDVVELTNRSRQAGRSVSADAVRIGGGYGNVARTVCDSLRKPGVDYQAETSGLPRYVEAARYWLQWAGFGERVYTPKEDTNDYTDDIMARAHWVNALAGGSQRLPDSVGLRIPIDMALAFHSDAGVREGDETIGTLGIYDTQEGKGKFEGGADRYRSRDLTDLVMSQIVGDIRRTYEPDWSRRGMWNKAYYEARIPGVPTMLLELLSHQNFADMRCGLDPRFKFLVSRAVYKGILRYLSSQYGVPYVVQPLPVDAPAVEFSGDDKVDISWSPTTDPLENSAAPTGYVVYTRIDGGDFDNGRYVKKTRLTVQQQSGKIYSYKITAVNDGGESFPSEIVSACRVPQEKGRVLVINGFDRVSAPVSMRCDSTEGFYGDLDSGVPYLRDISFTGAQKVFDRSMYKSENERLALGASDHDYEGTVIGGNTFDYPALHGRSIAAAGWSFCSASADAVGRSEVTLAKYPVVDLILGKQRSTTFGRDSLHFEFKTFSPALQRVLRKYMAGGGAAFVSGSYVATDLWTGENATDADRIFAREVLHYAYESERASQSGRVYTVSPECLSRGEYAFQTWFAPDGYRVESPDAIKPADKNARAVMRYAGSDRTAAVASPEGRTFVMGFPFETITSQKSRDRLMDDVLKFLSK